MEIISSIAMLSVLVVIILSSTVMLVVLAVYRYYTIQRIKNFNRLIIPLHCKNTDDMMYDQVYCDGSGNHLLCVEGLETLVKLPRNRKPINAILSTTPFKGSVEVHFHEYINWRSLVEVNGEFVPMLYDSKRILESFLKTRNVTVAYFGVEY
jgi:hypothetical protein